MYNKSLFVVVLFLAVGVAWACNPPSASGAGDEGGRETLVDRYSEGACFLGQNFWNGHDNLLLGRVEWDADQDGAAYNMTVLADLRGTFKPGSSVKIVCQFVGSVNPAQFFAADGATLLIAVEPVPDKPSFVNYVNWPRCPFGWSSPRVIPNADVKGKQDALATLRSVIPKHPNDPLDRDKALEFFKSKNYETWAVGASMLGAMHAQQADNAKLLMKVISDPSQDMIHVLWAYSALETMDMGDGGDDTSDDLHKEVFDGENRNAALYHAMLRRLVTQSPQLCDYPPPPAPATQPDAAATVHAGMVAKQGWVTDAKAQVQDAKPEEQAAMLLMGNDFWNQNGNLILAKVTAILQKSKDVGDVTYTMDVQADARGIYKNGAVVKVVGNLTPTDADWIPTFDKGMVVLLGVKPGDDKDTLAYTSNVVSPIGWRSGRPIPADHVQAVQTALGALQKALPQHAGDPLDHAKALDLFKNKEYETWALGASMLAAGGTEDYVLLYWLRGVPHPQLSQGVWVEYQEVRFTARTDNTQYRGGFDLVAFVHGFSPQLGGAYVSSPEQPTATAPATQP